MRKEEYIAGLKDGVPICLGYFSVSLAFGLTAVLSGMPVWAAVLTSITNLTSAGQFAGTNLMLAYGNMIEIALTMLIINARYFLMSLSVSQKVERKMTMPQRMAISYGITDEIFAVSMQRKSELTTPYMAGLITTPVIGWTLGTLTGAVASSLMPEMLASALGIALYGMFIAIIIPPAREQKSITFAIILAIAFSVAFPYIPLLNKLSSGWSIIVITIVVSAIAAWKFPIQPEGGEGNDELVKVTEEEVTK